MPDSTPIPPRKDGSREDHHLYYPAPSSLTTSFISGSPFANEILASDIADCSEDDADDQLHNDAQSLFSEADSQAGGPVLYKQPQGVAYGIRRPSILPERGGAEAVLNPIERLQSLDAERSLLRDNHILPPKHGGEHVYGPRRKPGFFSGLYRRLFSTKIRSGGSGGASPGGEQAPAVHVTRPSETSPLLDPVAAATAVANAGGSPEDINEQWESAVASGKIKTTWQREAQTIAVYSRSLIVTFLLQYSVNIASIFAVGRIGKLELGAVTCKEYPCPTFPVLYFVPHN